MTTEEDLNLKAKTISLEENININLGGLGSGRGFLSMMSPPKKQQ